MEGFSLFPLQYNLLVFAEWRSCISENFTYLKKSAAVQVGKREWKIDSQQEIFISQTLRPLWMLLFWICPGAQVMEPVRGFQ